MDGKAGNFDECRGCVEILVLELADCAAVDRIGVLRTEARHVKVVRALADLLVGGKGDFHRAMRKIGGQKQLCCRKNFRHACLVVRAEKRGAVGHDQALSCMVQKGFILARGKNDPLLLVQDDVAALVNFCDPRVNWAARRVRRGVHVGNQAVDRKVFFAVGGNCAVDVAKCIHARVLDAELLHLAHKLRAEYLLIGGRRILTAFLAGGRVEADKLQKSFNDCHKNAPFCFTSAPILLSAFAKSKENPVRPVKLYRVCSSELTIPSAFQILLRPAREAREWEDAGDRPLRTRRI